MSWTNESESLRSNSTTMASVPNASFPGPGEEAGVLKLGEEDLRNESLATIEILVLSVILFLAISGNGLMLLALRRQLKFRPMSRMYFYMMNLSLADLLVAFGNILPQLAWDITFRFQGNDLLCRVIKFLQTFVLYLSTFVLTSMAVDRYMVICHHTFSRNHYSGLKGPKILVLLSWVLSFIFASPQAFIFSLEEVKPGVWDCWTLMGPSSTKLYVTWFVCTVFLLPLLIIGLSYGAICVRVVSFNLPVTAGRSKAGNGGVSDSGSKQSNGRYWKKSSFSSSSASERRLDHDSGATDSVVLTKGSGSGERALKRQISQAKIKTLKLTLVVVICFFVCWAPFCLTQLIMVYDPPHPSMPVGPINVIFLLLASLNSCTNPWVYLAFSESLFNQLRICLGFGLGRGSDEESIGDEQEPQRYPAVPKCPKMRADPGEPLKAQPLRKIKSSAEPCGQEDQQPAQTKSEII